MIKFWVRAKFESPFSRWDNTGFFQSIHKLAHELQFSTNNSLIKLQKKISEQRESVRKRKNIEDHLNFENGCLGEYLKYILLFLVTYLDVK